MLKKFVLAIIIFILIFYLCLLFASQKKYDVQYGLSFSRKQAEHLGLDWQKTYLAMLDELKPKYIRISAPWDEIEQKKGVFETKALDWQMFEAEKRGVKVVLTIGQKAPRWPECHLPSWFTEEKEFDEKAYSAALLNYLKQVIEKYKSSAALEFWQVENEPFIRFRFGNCERFSKEMVNEEIILVRSLDPSHKIMVTDSGELSTWRRASKAGDIFGTTLYRIVRTPSGKVWNYDWLPAAFYRLKARFWGLNIKKVFVSELQAEPWFADGNANNTPLAVQEQTMNLARLQKHFDYVERIGVTRAYLWGVEWWYWMKEKQKDGRYWSAVREKLDK